MLVTLLGITTLVSPEQPQNAEYPMLVTLLEISMLFSPEQSTNAASGIFFTFSPIVTVDNAVQPLKTGEFKLPIVVQFTALNSTLLRSEQSLNA